MTEIITQLNYWAGQWWELLLPNSIQILIIFGLLFAISYFMKKSSAIFHYSLWLILLLKAILPFQFHINFMSNSNISSLENVYSTINLNGAVVNTESVSLSLQAIAFILWLGVCLFLTIRLILRETQFSKFLEEARPIDNDGILKSLQNKMEIDKKIEVRVSSKIPAPFTKGLIKPVVYLPEQATNLKKSQIKAIIAHELAHIKRVDIVSIYLQKIIRILYFFHPAIWITNKKVNLHREKICDEIALKTIQAKPRKYGEIMLDNLEYLFANKKRGLISNNLFFSKKIILQRFEYLFNKKEEVMQKLKRGHYLVIFATITLSVFLACTNSVDSQNENQAQSEQVQKSKSAQTDPSVGSGDQEKKFVEFDKPPKPVEGLEGIMKNIDYPKSAKEAGIEGTVVIDAFIDKKGQVQETKIKQGIPNTGLNDAAIAAMKQTEFTPAKKKGEPIGVWFTIPISFKLEGNK